MTEEAIRSLRRELKDLIDKFEGLILICQQFKDCRDSEKLFELKDTLGRIYEEWYRLADQDKEKKH